MIPILDFSLHQFKTISMEEAILSDLLEAGKQQSDLFVLRIVPKKFLALVIPEFLKELVEPLIQQDEAQRDATAAKIGLLDLLRQGQMVVDKSQPAHQVAELAARYEVETVIVVNDDDDPVGLFIPSVVIRRLIDSQPFNNASEELRGKLRKRVAEFDLGGAIADLDGEFQRVHSESLNLNASDPYVCSSTAGRHLVRKCPCKKHGGDPHSSCRRRTVAP